MNPTTAAGAGIGTVIFPGPGTVVGAIIGTGVGLWIGYELTIASGPMRSDKYAPGFIDAVEGSRRWGKEHGVRNAVDIFHDIKKGDRGRPGSKAADGCSVNPETGDVNNGIGENIGNLGDGA